MPIRVTLRVKRGSALPIHERAKKQRMTNVPRIRVKSEIVNTAEEVTVKTEEIDDGSIGDHGGAIESALCEPSYDPHLSHSTSTSSTTSKQCTSRVVTSDNAEICAFKSTLESDLDSISNQDGESPAMNDVFSELQCEEESENEEVDQSSTAHGPAAISFVLKNKNKISSWDERFKELVDFKAINGHIHFVLSSRPLGTWVRHQRTQYRLFKEGKHSILTSERHEKLESIGFVFKAHPRWDERFQELVAFKKINGHANVPYISGPLGRWVSSQRTHYRVLNEGKYSQLTNERCEKLESIGFVFKLPCWNQKFQELVDFKKINGHTLVPTNSGPLGYWVKTQRQAFRLLKEGKDSPLKNEIGEKLESIGFSF
eukprot:scaffold34115_cov46-Attheya_sp.AAC.1